MLKPQEPIEPDLYFDLELDQSASAAEIVAAYKRLALRYHPDKIKVAPGQAVDANKFRQLKHARDVLVNPWSRAAYDAEYSRVLAQWIAYNKVLAEWKEKEAERQMRQAKAEWRRRNREEERLRQAQDQLEAEKERKMEERAHAEAESARKEKEEVEAAEETRKDAERKQARQECAARKAARNQKWREAQERSRKVLERAQEERRRNAEARLRQGKEMEADAKMREASKLARAEEQLSIAAEGIRAAEARKGAVDEDAKPGLDLSREQQAEDKAITKELLIQRKEAEAAGRFIQDIMRIRGESRGEVLKDAALIFLEAVDLDLKAERAKSRKRKFGGKMEDPARLPSLVADLFAKLETSGGEEERFRFAKKRRES